MKPFAATCWVTTLSLLLLCSVFTFTHSVGLVETERIAEFHARNHTWPIEEFIPNTPGWKKLMEHRLRQIAEIEDRDKRYEGYVQTMNAAVVAPNFTEHGFALARAPDDLMEALRKGIREGLEKGPRLEPDVEVIDGDTPWFIDRPDLTGRVLEELQHYPEGWVNMELVAFKAYGFRLYRNNSQLHMHVDKPQTHVVSFILHIDSSEDAEPWPIVIEDYNGNTHEVVLTSGDIVFYESSKVFHGRPHRFKGSWYSSVFVHYYPKIGWQDTDHMIDRHYAVPPGWSDEPQHHFEVPLKMVGTGLTEPTCPNNWCQTRHSIFRNEAVPHGVLIAPNGDVSDFDPLGMTIQTNKNATDCRDDYPECEEWAKWDSNECERNVRFMHANCKKSCRVCTTNENNNGGGGGDGEL
mmetsp:Transcript_20328/g.42359  ORF Transcript_20328/g.42359 Transcript_20328/m.42359 type:complete len:408 (-) Transcript_20328:376-1599(-)|eukprot:CAMPEP_0201127370 /NCGR_PEP_ID=MMETSP0850-20130426/30083_1 /ASSEMBLY_ACC=CAM_ASM_000622 /TAXON_ID=183588 /ORGANISM="Pseudo-nitzschia fraudulenta, Strain WWA7" /LENGTH=407 /DNA_ID=CAMNT_0047396213 /DNA_START=400 /DNA_END=1623 /DNA_ORIENTATION=+